MEEKSIRKSLEQSFRKKEEPSTAAAMTGGSHPSELCLKEMLKLCEYYFRQAMCEKKKRWI
jgi:hypothetical protein